MEITADGFWNLLMFLFSFVSSSLFLFVLSLVITFSLSQSPMPWMPVFSPWATGRPQSPSGTPGSELTFTLNPPAPAKLSHPVSTPLTSSPRSSLSPPFWPPQAHLDTQSAFSLNEGQGEAKGSLDVDPQPLHIASQGYLSELGQRACHDVSTLTGRSLFFFNGGLKVSAPPKYTSELSWSACFFS